MALVPHLVTALEQSNDPNVNTLNTVSGAVVSLFNSQDQAVLLYDDETGANPSTTKITDSSGQVVVWVAAGEYDERVNGGVKRRVSVGNEEITTAQLIDRNRASQAGDIVTTSGYLSEGDGGSTSWVRTASTGTPSQSPQDRNDGTLTDANGAVWEVKTTGLVSPMIFGGGWAGLKVAWNYKKEITLEHGVTYNLEENLTANNESVVIIGNGAKFYSPVGGGSLRINGSYSNDQSVTAVDPFYVEVPDASFYKTGDTIKIYNDEFTPYGRYQNESEGAEFTRKGEFFVVNRIDSANNRLEFKENLFFTYNLSGTNTRISKLEDIPVKVVDLSFEMDENADESQALTLFRVESLNKLVVNNCLCERSMGSNFMWVHSCHAAKISITTDYILDASEEAGFSSNSGYGVNLINSENCIVHNSIFKGCRHGVDGVGRYDSTSSRPQTRYGISRNNKVIGCEGYRCTNSAFSTHHGTYGWSFQSNSSSYNEGGGIAIRGVGHKVQSLTSENDEYGIWEFAQESTSLTEYNVYSDITIKDPVVNAMRSQERVTSNTNGINIIITKESSIERMFNILQGSNVKISNCVVTTYAPLPNFDRMFNLDFSATSRITLDVFDFTLNSRGGDLQNEQWTFFNNSNATTINHDITGDNIRMFFNTTGKPRNVFNVQPSSDSLVYKTIMSSDSFFTVANQASGGSGFAEFVGPVYVGNSTVY